MVRIVEERDIAAGTTRRRARRCWTSPRATARSTSSAPPRCGGICEDLTNANAQGQYYLTDIIAGISRDGGDIRTITTTVADPEYDLLCSDVTQPMDLALLEGILASARGLLFPEELEVEEAARAIAAGRPAAQVASIARQLEELMAAVRQREAGLPARPARGHRHLRRAPAHRLHAPGHGAVLRPGLADAHRRGRRGRRRADRRAGPGRRRPPHPPLSR